MTQNHIISLAPRQYSGSSLWLCQGEVRKHCSVGAIFWLKMFESSLYIGRRHASSTATSNKKCVESKSDFHSLILDSILNLILLITHTSGRDHSFLALTWGWASVCCWMSMSPYSPILQAAICIRGCLSKVSLSSALHSSPTIYACSSGESDISWIVHETTSSRT